MYPGAERVPRGCWPVSCGQIGLAQISVAEVDWIPVGRPWPSWRLQQRPRQGTTVAQRSLSCCSYNSLLVVSGPSRVLRREGRPAGTSSCTAV